MAMAEAEVVECPIKMIEHGRISPPPNSVPTSISLPLSFLDIKWMWPIFAQRVFFYEFPHPNPDNFAQKIVPALKSSLSIALEKFYPFAAKIVVPPLPREPQFVYTDGDSVPFTVAESTLNFHELISNDPQDVKLLNPLVPELPWCISEEGIYTMTPLLAVQVTLFPNSGICLGLTFNHAVCDGRSFQHFIKSWASICRTGEIRASLPFLDRGIVEDPNDLKTTFLKEWWDFASKHPNPSSRRRIFTEQRATFVFSKTSISRLKTWISNRSTILGLEPLKISSFAAVCAFTWVCIVKSTAEEALQVPRGTDDSDISHLRHFYFLADCRRRLKTPLPESYFGNCLVECRVAMEEQVLLGQDGTVLAANAIIRQVKELENGGADRMSNTRRLGFPLTVAGSPWLAVYDTDFGWGRPKKSAVAHIHLSWSISLAESRDEKGGMEVGVALTKPSMDAFTTLFNQLESFVV